MDTPGAALTVLLPPALRRGDRVAVVSPSSPVLSAARLDTGLDVLRRWGLEPVCMPHVHDRDGHLAGTDADRAADINTAFTDPSIRGVVATRGGFGAVRVVDRLDWEALGADPKPLVGFSDLTAVLLEAWRRLELVTVHATFAGRLGAAGAAAADRLRRLLTDPSPPAPLHGTRTVAAGAAEGRLLGGNLATICSLLATPAEPATAGAVLLLEEVNEAPYRLDRMLTQLRRGGLLSAVAGIAVGALHRCDPPRDRPSATPEEVVDSALGGLGVPVVAGLPVGHLDDQAAVAHGARVRLDGDAATLTFLDAAVAPPPP